MAEFSNTMALVLGTLTACAAVWILSEAGRRLTVRGSRQRYVLATIEHGTRYPALFYLVLSVFLEFFFGDLAIGVLNCVAVALWAAVFYEKRHNGEDDDWFNDQFKKLKKRLAATSWGRRTVTGAA